MYSLVFSSFIFTLEIRRDNRSSNRKNKFPNVPKPFAAAYGKRHLERNTFALSICQSSLYILEKKSGKYDQQRKRAAPRSFIATSMAAQRTKAQ